jgi:hypothetical protein
MKPILSLFLIAFLIQNILASGDFDIKIYGIVPADDQIYGKLIGCFNTAQTPMYSFYLDVATTGFTEKKYEWKLLLDDKFTYANCEIYGNYETQQIACAVNILLYPLNAISFPTEYKPYNQNEAFTVTGWENIASKPILDKPCYPSYLYSFVPSANTQHETVCDSAGNNQVTIYGAFEKTQTPSQNVRRLSTDGIEFEPILIVDGTLGKAVCSIKETAENSSEDAMVCVINGKKYFEFFPTTAVEKVENVNVLVETSKQLGLAACASSFLKIGGILLASLLLL